MFCLTRPLLAVLAALALLCSQHGAAGSPSAPVHTALVTSPRAALSGTASSTAAGLQQAWSQTVGSPSVEIAIVDTGVTALPAFGVRLQTGFDFVSGGTKATDANGHGTAMASIAAAQTTTVAGKSSGLTGVCRRCTIVPVRVVGSGGIGTTQLAAEGIRWAVANGARVINLSLTTQAEDPTLTAAIGDAVSAGVIVVLASGNEGSNSPAGGGYPAGASPEAITVGSVNSQGALYPWSNHGQWVDVAAPGQVGALTTAGRVTTVQGTSASAAFVSGVVGLMLSVAPSLTPAQVQSILLGAGTVSPGLDVLSDRVLDVNAAVAAAAATA